MTTVHSLLSMFNHKGSTSFNRRAWWSREERKKRARDRALSLGMTSFPKTTMLVYRAQFFATSVPYVRADEK